MTRILRTFSRPRPTTVETTQRALQCRSLLRPGKELNDRVVGCLARALELYPIQLHAFVAMSTHYHCLATYDDPEVMARFHYHLNANLSKEVGKLYNWPGTVFPDRYHHVELSTEPEAELARLRYLMENATKENLCLSPLDWPGVSSTESLITGEPLKGKWIDRTAFHEALETGESVSEEDFAEEMEIHFVPLPSLVHLDPQDRRRLMVDLVRDIEEKTLARHRAEGTTPLGITTVLSRDPSYRPQKINKSPRPWFHVLDPKLRKVMTTALVYILNAYREAADRLKAGDLDVAFPVHTFPPGQPFVREVEILEPG